MGEPTPTPPGVWTGRFDGPGPEHRRWYQRVGVTTGTTSVALVGFASDEGVRRNHGRSGAAAGPDALRAALAPLAMHVDTTIHDAGTIDVRGEDLESAQDRLGRVVGGLLDRHDLVVVLGGGHDSAWGSYLGRHHSSRLRGARIGVINLDAHFDLRSGPQATSGTAFRQMADADRQAGIDFRYLVLGIAAASNTSALFAAAADLGAGYRLDEDCTIADLPAILADVDTMLGAVDGVHLSIDLDVLPAAVAPGVSAPAAYGVPLDVVLPVLRRIAGSGKLAIVDIVELNPRFDVDGRTARCAARLIHSVVSTWAQHQGPSDRPGSQTTA